jgi:hypothetical protein
VVRDERTQLDWWLIEFASSVQLVKNRCSKQLSIENRWLLLLRLFKEFASDIVEE